MPRYEILVPIKIEVHGYMIKSFECDETDPEEIKDAARYDDEIGKAEELKVVINQILENYEKDHPGLVQSLKASYITSYYHVKIR